MTHNVAAVGKMAWSVQYHAQDAKGHHALIRGTSPLISVMISIQTNIGKIQYITYGFGDIGTLSAQW